MAESLLAITLESIRSCFDGALSSVIATRAPDGTPSAAYTSQLHYIDSGHVALPLQFFNKTHENMLANSHATVQVVDPETGQHYQLALRYLRTETSGPLFEKMKALRVGSAAHPGMSGSDIYEVMRITRAPSVRLLARQSSPYNRVAALRKSLDRLLGCGDLAGLFATTLHSLSDHFEMRQAMVLMLDESGQRLFPVASQGYAESRVGTEILLGEGVIGVAAQHRSAIRINHLAHEYLHNCAVPDGYLRKPGAQQVETGSVTPGLSCPRSQLAVPIMLRNTLLGVLYVESPLEQRFTHEDEDALVALANTLALAVSLHGQGHGEQGMQHSAARHPVSDSQAVIRHYATDDTIFINDDYLIKGVAGAILWKLVREHRDHQRSEFCNRELRLDSSLGLPEVIENLEARLILLQRRLAERCPFVTIEKTGRGRFRLRVDRPLQLSEA